MRLCTEAWAPAWSSAEGFAVDPSVVAADDQLMKENCSEASAYVDNQDRRWASMQRYLALPRRPTSALPKARTTKETNR